MRGDDRVAAPLAAFHEALAYWDDTRESAPGSIGEEAAHALADQRQRELETYVLYCMSCVCVGDFPISTPMTAS